MIIISNTVGEPILEMKGIHKIFPGVHALKNVDFSLHPGRVYGLVGENGAGKSTLMNILGGVFPPTSGYIQIDGKEVTLESTAKAEELGISFIHQELSLFSNLDIATNIFIQHLPKKFNLLAQKKLYHDTQAILDIIKLSHYKPSTMVENLRIGEQQLVEIGRALSQNTRILVLDEPTSSLTKPEIHILFDIVKDLRSKGVAVVFISHRLDEIYEICDEITIMRDGERLLTTPLNEIERPDIIRNMIGKDMDEFYEHPPHMIGETLLEVKGLTRKNKLNQISFTLRKGELVGLYGLMGSGRTEIIRSIFGLDKIDSGDLLIEGKPVTIKSPVDAINNKIAMVSEDRHFEGLILGDSVVHNISLASLKAIQKVLSFIDTRKETAIADENIKKLSIKTPSIKRHVRFLSGGNQQKVVIAKWLNTNPQILLLDEPTRGVDVGAKREIYTIIEVLLKQGLGVFMVSSELPELIGLCDCVLVIKEGSLVAKYEKNEITVQNLLSSAMGV